MKGLFKVVAMVMAFILGSFVPVFAQDETMSETAGDALSSMSTLFMQNLNTSQTLGKPFEAGEYTIIPVVAKGLGFGLGTKLEAKDFEAGGGGNGKNESKQKDRIGLGGAGFVKPVALIMIKKNGEFKVVKLCDGIFAQFAKYMLPAISSMVRKTIMTISAEKLKHDKARGKKNKPHGPKKPAKPENPAPAPVEQLEHKGPPAPPPAPPAN